MSRKIIPLQSFSLAAATNGYLPKGSRLHSVKGEADGKPTYDFVITGLYGSTTANSSAAIKYAGARNGNSVNLMRDWPEVVSLAAVPTAGDFNRALQIGSGAGVTLQVFYFTSDVAG